LEILAPTLVALNYSRSRQIKMESDNFLEVGQISAYIFRDIRKI